VVRDGEWLRCSTMGSVMQRSEISPYIQRWIDEALAGGNNSWKPWLEADTLLVFVSDDPRREFYFFVHESSLR